MGLRRLRRAKRPLFADDDVAVNKGCLPASPPLTPEELNQRLMAISRAKFDEGIRTPRGRRLSRAILISNGVRVLHECAPIGAVNNEDGQSIACDEVVEDVTPCSKRRKVDESDDGVTCVRDVPGGMVGIQVDVACEPLGTCAESSTQAWTFENAKSFFTSIPDIAEEDDSDDECESSGSSSSHSDDEATSTSAQCVEEARLLVHHVLSCL